MKRRASILIAAALLLTAAPALGETDIERFRLWNECRPMDLLVEGLSDEETAVGLTKDAIKVAVRSRLRAARLYSENDSESVWSYLYFNVTVVGSAFSIDTKYQKIMSDIFATRLEYPATTWYIGMTGTHSGNSSFILSNVAQYADKFIDEYLRVNEAACK